MELQYAIAAKNNLSKEMYQDAVPQEIAKKYHETTEIGIIGEALEYVFALIASIHPETISDPAFEQWRKDVHEIKARLKTELNISETQD